jgi:hypothetical protein
MTTGHKACFNCKFGRMVYTGLPRYNIPYVCQPENQPGGGVYLITDEIKEAFCLFGCSKFIAKEEKV